MIAAALLAFPAPLPQEPITAHLQGHALFSRLSLETIGETGPRVRLLVETPKRPSETHLPAAEAGFAPWVSALDTVFETSFVLPNKLERRDQPELGVILLANGPSFSNATRYQTRHDELAGKCLYIEEPTLIVTLWNERAPVDKVREPVLTRMVDRLFDSYYKGAGKNVGERWLVEGVTGYWINGHPEATSDELFAPRVNPKALERTAAYLSDPRTAGLVLPFAKLMGARSVLDREKLVGPLASGAGVRLDSAGIQQLFRDQAALWVHYLERGDVGRHQQGFRHYVAKALHGNGSPLELEATVGTSLDKLDDGFRAHLEFLSGGGNEGPVSIGEAAPLHPELWTPPETADEILAEALGRASIGRIEEALMFLEGGLRSTRGPDRDRIGNEIGRLRAVMEAREAYAQALVGDKRRVRWEAGGESYSAQVSAYADGVMTLAKNKADRETFRLEEWGAPDLRRSMGSKLEEYAPAWVEGYLKMLSGDERWARDLADDEPLKNEIGLLPLAQQGEVRARLAVLARTEVPDDRDGRAEVLAEVTELASRVTEKSKPALRDFATLILARDYDSAGLERRLNGKVRRESKGRVSITYEFDDAAELKDFLPLEGYLEDRHARLPDVGKVAKPGWQIRDGNLVGSGKAALRHLAALEAPIQLEYQLAYARAPKGATQFSTVLVAVCDDGQGSYVGAWDLFDMDAIDLPSGYVRTAYEEGERIVPPARTNELRLDHSGAKATLKVGGAKRREIATGPRNSGATLLWCHGSSSVAVKRLVIRGKPVTSEDDPARVSWIESELAAIGL